MQLSPEHALLKALRRGRHEAQLTQALGAVFAGDTSLAAAFVRLVLACVPKRVPPTELPHAFECRAEESAPEGRFDLSFRSLDGSWHVIVELKIDVGYGDVQLERYLRSFDRRSSRRILAAITRNVPTYGDLPLEAHPSWHGSVRWAELLDGLRMLTPQNEQLAAQWPLFLDVLESEGSMGFTTASAELFRAWELSLEARSHVEDFVDALRVPLLSALQDALVAAGSDRTAGLYTRGKGQRAVLLSQQMVQVSFEIPAGHEVRVQAGMWGWKGLHFEVKTTQPRVVSPEAEAAVTALARRGFGSWRGRSLGILLPIDDEMLGRHSLQEEILDWARERFGEIAASGILNFASDGLPIGDGVGETLTTPNQVTDAASSE